MKRFFLPVLALAVALCAAPGAQAQGYPSKPIRAVVAFGTGGATDVIARIIAASLSESLGQAVVIHDQTREQTEVWRGLTKAAG